MNQLVVAVLFFGLSGCAGEPKMDYRSFIIPEDFNHNPQKQLTTKELKEDQSKLDFAFNNIYSGKNYLPDNQFARLIKDLNSIKAPITSLEFCDALAENFQKVSDNHLQSLFLKSKGDGVNCSFAKPSLHRTAQVGKNYFQSDKMFWDVRLKRIKKSNALLISIKEFENHNDPRWTGFLDKVKLNLPKAKLVILDLRGNSGGDDSIGYDLSTILAGAQLKSSYLIPQWINLSPESIQSWINGVQLFALFSKQQGLDTSFQDKMKNDLTNKRNLAIQGKLTTEMLIGSENIKDLGVDFDYKKSVQKPIYILMDAKCASSCESTIDSFEYNPLVKKIGENSEGAIHFTNEGLFVLDKSGVIIQMATSFNSYKDHRFLEKIGIAPDIRTEAGKDALADAITDYFAHRASN